MAKLVFRSLLLSVVIAGCGRSEADKHREAVLRALDADHEHSQAMKNAEKQVQSLHDYARIVDAYCAALEKLDMADCPSDFRLAFRRHIRAWRDAESAIRRMPDGFWEGVLTGLINAATGEADGGYRRITAEGEALDRKIRETYEEVEAIAAEYGAAR